MSTFDRQAMIERADREYDEDVERMRIKNKGDMYPIWGMLAFGLFACHSDFSSLDQSDRLAGGVVAGTCRKTTFHVSEADSYFPENDNPLICSVQPFLS
jgi:hypothetical protein